MPSRHDPDCSTRDGSALASVRVSGVLALEIAKSGWATQDRAGTAGSHPPHEQGESALGRAPDPWRTSQTRVRIGPVDGLEVHGPRSNAARPELKDIFAQPGRWHRRDVPTLTFERLFAFGFSATPAAGCFGLRRRGSRRRSGWRNRLPRHFHGIRRQPIWCAIMMARMEKSSGVASDRWGSATDRVTGEEVNPLIRTHLSPSGRGKTPGPNRQHG